MFGLVTSVRYSALAEGVSYLVLIFIAMPLKYFADQPLAVSIFGMAHGVLFIIVCGLLALAWWRNAMSFNLCFFVFVLSLIPFGAFWADRKIQAQCLQA